MAAPSVPDRIADERGMTLVELLVSLSVGIVILLAVFAMIDVSFSQSAKVTDRVDALQRGRIAMDNITRQLRSQVCRPVTGASLTQGDDNSLTFYADLSGGNSAPEQRRLAYDSTTNNLTEYVYVGSGTWPDQTFSNTPTRTRDLLTNAAPLSGVPVFSYYAFTTTGTITPSVRLSTPLSSTDLPRVVRVTVNFVSRPARTNQSPQSTTFQNQVDVRTTDPNNPTESTRCV